MAGQRQAISSKQPQYVIWKASRIWLSHCRRLSYKLLWVVLRISLPHPASISCASSFWNCDLIKFEYVSFSGFSVHYSWCWFLLSPLVLVQYSGPLLWLDLDYILWGFFSLQLTQQAPNKHSVINSAWFAVNPDSTAPGYLKRRSQRRDCWVTFPL